MRSARRAGARWLVPVIESISGTPLRSTRMGSRTRVDASGWTPARLPAWHKRAISVNDRFRPDASGGALGARAMRGQSRGSGTDRGQRRAGVVVDHHVRAETGQPRPLLGHVQGGAIPVEPEVAHGQRTV